jgi:general secretion pathway protein G
MIYLCQQYVYGGIFFDESSVDKRKISRCGERKIMKRTRNSVVQGAEGFTLIELMVVIVVLGLLAGMVLPKIIGNVGDAKTGTAKSNISSFETALRMYKLDNGSYPETEQGLQALVEAPTTGTAPKKWRKGGYLEKKGVPKDPWDRDYIYICPGVHGDYDISSLGKDGMAGGEDEDKDVNSWDLE